MYFPFLFLLICVFRRSFRHTNMSVAMALSKEELVNNVQSALKSHQSGDISNALLGMSLTHPFNQLLTHKTILLTHLIMQSLTHTKNSA